MPAGAFRAAVIRAAVVPALAAVAAAQAFDQARFERDLERIVPAAEERAWRTLPWQAELRSALQQASERGMPVLLWAMNGHPLGQT